MNPLWALDDCLTVAAKVDTPQPFAVVKRMPSSAQHRQQQFAAVFTRYQPVLLGVARRLAKNASDAQDLVQDTSERALLRFDQLQAATNPQAWLITVMHHLFIDQCRQRKSQSRREAVVAPVAVPEPEPAWSHITPEEVQRMVDTLDDEFRSVYEMHCVEGKSYREIALALRCKPVTVGTRLTRARQKLRTLLAPLLLAHGGDDDL